MRTFLLIAGFVSPIAVLYYWFGGLIGGFRLWGKIPNWLKRWWRRYAMLTYLSCAGAAGVAGLVVSKGCISMPVAASLVTATPESYHSLGKLAQPSFPTPPALDWKTLFRLKREDVKRQRALQKELRRETIAAAKDFGTKFQISALHFLTPNGVQLKGLSMMSSEIRETPKENCHVTCYAHHGAQYDRETLPEYCNANWISPKAEFVPGWWPIDDNHEITAAWPGPATPGFHSYKLYWTGK